MLKRLKKNNKGNIILVTLMILTAVLTACLGAAALVAQGIILHRTQKGSTSAFFASETGTEKILWEIRKNNFQFLRADGSGCQANDYINFSADCFEDQTICCQAAQSLVLLSTGATFEVRSIATTPEYIIHSTGEYSGSKRMIEITIPKE
ncbi:MAG: hypothetical protein WCW77_05760 [Patescibacteria group bacterium]|jgi:hypothetical protein